MRHFGPLIICILLLSACSPPYKKAGGGFEYKILDGGKGKKLEYGRFLEFHLRQWYVNGKKDTVLGDTRDYMQRIEAFDSLTMPPLYLKILSEARQGDSVTIRIPTDSAYRQFISRMPAQFKPGGYIYTSIKLLNIFDTRREADSVNLAEFRLHSHKIYQKTLHDFEEKLEKQKPRIALDSKMIMEYLDKKGMKYIKGNWGSFIVIHEKGSGRKIAYNDVVGINYSRRSFDGSEIFDSNLDPKFKHTGLYEITMSRIGDALTGLTDALLQLREGDKASVYIPSSLAYGQKGRGNKIKPNENVVFDIEVKAVITEFQAMEIVSENNRREEARRIMEDSLPRSKNRFGF